MSSIEFYNIRLISQYSDPAFTKYICHLIDAVISLSAVPSVASIIVVAEAGENTEFAFNFSDEFDNFFSIFSVNIASDIVSGHYDNISVQLVYSFNAMSKVFCADGFAAVQVADVYESDAVEFTW